MKKYTLEDFDSFERDGVYIICPSGDYSGIMEFPSFCSFGEGCSFDEQCLFGRLCRFGEQCSFGERCRFSEWCSFGEGCSFGKQCTCEDGKEFCDFLKFERFGSEHRCTYFFKLTDGKIYVRCDCFAGYIDEFRAQVKEAHGNSKFAEGYLKIADLAEWQLEEEGGNADE